MAQIEKGSTVNVDMLVDAVNANDQQIETLKGSVGFIEPLAATVKDIQARMDDVLRRATADSGTKARFPGLSPEMKSRMTLDLLHKAPSMPERLANGMAKEPDADDVIGTFQRDCDSFYIYAAARGHVDKEGRITPSAKNTPYYKDVFRPAVIRTREFMQKEGMDTATAGEGLEYVPTEHSSRLFDLVQLEPGLQGYFENVPMARGTQEFPAWLDDLVMSLVGERTADGYDASTTGRMPDMLGSRSVTGSVTFTAVKFGGIVFWSKDLEEDSIVPLLPLLQRKVIVGAKRARETSIINGATGTHIDTDTEAGAATLAERAYNGLRKIGLAGTAVKNAEGNTITTDAAWNDYIRGALPLMGAYKSKGKSNLLRILSGAVETQIGSVPKFATMYAMGGRASNQGSEAGYGMFPDGIECYESEFARDDLAASGVNAASGNDFTSVLTVFKPAFAVGVRREIRLELSRERFFEFDQDAIKVTMRQHFKQVLTVGAPVAVTRNIGQ